MGQRRTFFRKSYGRRWSRYNSSLYVYFIVFLILLALSGWILAIVPFFFFARFIFGGRFTELIDAQLLRLENLSTIEPNELVYVSSDSACLTYKIVNRDGSFQSTAGLVQLLNERLKGISAKPFVLAGTSALVAACVAATDYALTSWILGCLFILITYAGSALYDFKSRGLNVTYSLDKSESERFSILQNAVKQLSNSDHLLCSHTFASKINPKWIAGGTSTVSQTPMSAGMTRVLPFLKANFEVAFLKSPDFQIFFAPDQILFRQLGAYYGFDYDAIKWNAFSSTVIERNSVPKDAEITGYTWDKVNKDGSPDRRFKFNEQLPLVLYRSVEIFFDPAQSVTIQISSMSLADKFERALRSLPRTRSVGSESGKNSNRRRNTYERFRSADESKEASEAKRKSKTDSSIDDTGNVDLEDAQSTTYRKKSPAPKTLEWAFMILNIDSNSSRQEIDSAYRKLAKQNHPDRVNDMAPEFSALAERKMKEINSAYEIIENELYG